MEPHAGGVEHLTVSANELCKIILHTSRCYATSSPHILCGHNCGWTLDMDFRPNGNIDFFKQGSYMSGRVKFKDFSRTFKAMYQEIQGPIG